MIEPCQELDIIWSKLEKILLSLYDFLELTKRSLAIFSRHIYFVFHTVLYNTQSVFVCVCVVCVFVCLFVCACICLCFWIIISQWKSSKAKCIIILSENEPSSLFPFQSHHISLPVRYNDEKARPVHHVQSDSWLPARRVERCSLPCVAFWRYYRG